jgi:hypothetical protein
LSVADCNEAIATARSQSLRAIDFLDFETAHRYQNEITIHIAHRVSLQFDQIRTESTSELQSLESSYIRSLSEAESFFARERLSLKRHYDPIFRELHDTQLRELHDLNKTFQATLTERRRKRVRKQESANDEAQQSARNDDFETAQRLKLHGELIADEKFAHREASVRESIDEQKSELLIRHQEEANRIISEFDRKNEALERAFGVKKLEIDRDFWKAVEILKQKAVIKCQVLETDQSSIAGFVNQITITIDDSVKHCLTSTNDGLEQTRKEGMRMRALEVTKLVLNGSREDTECTLRKKAQLTNSKRSRMRPFFQTEVHPTFSDRPIKS